MTMTKEKRLRSAMHNGSCAMLEAPNCFNAEIPRDMWRNDVWFFVQFQGQPYSRHTPIGTAISAWNDAETWFN